MRMTNPFLCPLSSDVFEFPVIATDGYTYERCAIEIWIKMKGDGQVPSPMSNAFISMDSLVPNGFVADAMNHITQIGVDVSKDLTTATATKIQMLIESNAIPINCPLTSMPIIDPVVYRDGLTYERAAIEEYTLFPEDLISNIWYSQLLSTIQKFSQQVLETSAPPYTSLNKPVDLEDILLCPISFELMRDPVIARDGFTYERQHIVEWIRLKGVSPMTSEQLKIEDLISNILIRHIIETSQSSLLAEQEMMGSGHKFPSLSNSTHGRRIILTTAMHATANFTEPVTSPIYTHANAQDGSNQSIVEPDRKKLKGMKKLSRAMKYFFHKNRRN